MNTIEDIQRRIRERAEIIQNQAPEIIAEMATNYFRNKFETKEWDGTPWQPAKNPPDRGSLMLRSGALRESVQVAHKSSSLVIIGAGSPKVPYAQIHNEGGTINHPGGTAYFKKDGRFAWVSNDKAKEGKYPRTKPHPITIPQRRFMGNSAELNQGMIGRINELLRAVK